MYNYDVCYRGQLFCMSPNCKNKCGKQMSRTDYKEARKSGYFLCTAYFCGKRTRLVNEHSKEDLIPQII